MGKSFLRAVGVSALMLVSGSAMAADPLCREVRDATTRARCECNSENGGRVSRGANNRIEWTRPNKAQPAVFECMRKRGLG